MRLCATRLQEDARSSAPPLPPPATAPKLAYSPLPGPRSCAPSQKVGSLTAPRRQGQGREEPGAEPRAAATFCPHAADASVRFRLAAGSRKIEGCMQHLQEGARRNGAVIVEVSLQGCRASPSSTHGARQRNVPRGTADVPSHPPAQIAQRQKRAAPRHGGNWHVAGHQLKP